jgi:hypothetical protein
MSAFRQKPNSSRYTTRPVFRCVRVKSGTQTPSASGMGAGSSLSSHAGTLSRKLAANRSNSFGVYVPKSGAGEVSPSVVESWNVFAFFSAPHRTSADRSNALECSTTGRNRASCRPYFCVAENRDIGPSTVSVYEFPGASATVAMRRWNLTARNSCRNRAGDSDHTRTVIATDRNRMACARATLYRLTRNSGEQSAKVSTRCSPFRSANNARSAWSGSSLSSSAATARAAARSNAPPTAAAAFRCVAAARNTASRTASGGWSAATSYSHRSSSSLDSPWCVNAPGPSPTRAARSSSSSPRVRPAASR